MDNQRELRRQTDDLVRADKTRQFTIEDIAHRLEVGASSLVEALSSAVRCPFDTCQSFDTALSESLNKEFEVHHCNRCSRNFLVQRDPGGDARRFWNEQQERAVDSEQRPDRV
ncbi:MAG: hypothetical protein AUI33_10045 [Ignavibacteria bacterium 13_1_40CM_2_61_4]|nr:MAG: hypothetical protein AUI33_10045 [Ignavibacteria bacterium 13_1_40CM_2_61_4]